MGEKFSDSEDFRDNPYWFRPYFLRIYLYWNLIIFGLVSIIGILTQESYVLFALGSIVYFLLPLFFYHRKKYDLAGITLLLGSSFLIYYRGYLVSSGYMLTFLSVVIIVSAIITDRKMVMYLAALDLGAMIFGVYMGRFRFDQLQNPDNGLIYSDTISVVLPLLLVSTVLAYVISNIVIGTIQKQQRLQEQLVQAAKMEAIGRFAGGIAHDFNNLLTVIIGNVSLLLDRISSEDPLSLDLREIKKAADQAGNLTRQILAFGRKQIMQPKPLSVIAMLGSISDIIHRLIGENIELKMIMPVDAPPIYVDPNQFEQIIFNLCANARDAMPNGGKLTIEAKTEVIAQEFISKHWEAKEGKYIVISISDNGQGMTKDVITHLFEPFFTTKEKGRGTGLGLSIVFGIVRQSNGYITVYSEPGVGTTFNLYLPLYCSVEDAPFSDSPVAPTRIDSKKPIAPIPVIFGKILLVEDDDAIRIFCQKVLELAHVEVLAFPNPENVLKLPPETLAEYSLLITDVIMPKMSGKQLAETLIPRHPQLKVLYISGYAENSIVHHGILDPTVNFLQKPFDGPTLLNKISNLQN